MTSVQERLQLKRMALDNWSIKEKLCLASAVSCSGDQNWMSVSRSLKMLCGSNRPADWFSQKSCAVQYGELLENVETPKRKKRTISERDNSITETPTESILRKLTQERISELKSQIQKDQEEYAKLREEILLAQNVNVTEAQLKEMWAQIEQEQEQKVAEQQKYSQWLKEREERKTELQKAWRPGTFSQAQSQTQQQGQKSSQTSIKQEEMEVDDTTSTKHGTAPLLTSLLKSPSPAPSSSATAVAHSTSVASTTGARIVAPTITNLLTGNTTITTQITSTSVTTPVTSNQQQYHPIQTKPLTGPSPPEHPQQIAPSPSQAAPTLSMLLENKNKEEQMSNQTAIATTSTTATTTTTTAAAAAAAAPKVGTATEQDEEERKVDQAEAMETEDGENSTNKDDDQQLMEVFNRLIPDNIIIDELEDILTNNNAIILNPDLLEEESILEDVDSLIDDEQDDVNDNKATTANAIANSSTADNETMQEKQQTENADSKNLSDSSDSIKVKEEIKEENATKLDPKNIPKIEDSSGGGTAKSEPNNKAIPEIENVKNEIKKEAVEEESSKQTDTKPTEVKEEKIEEKVQKIDSSDDSSDNTTLQILKDKINVDVKTTDSNEGGKESSVENVLMEITTATVASKETTDPPVKEEKPETKVNLPEPMDSRVSECKETESVEIKKPVMDTTEIIIIGEDSDSNESKPAIEKQEIKKVTPPKKSESPVKISKQEIERSKSPEKQSTSKQSAISEKSSALAAVIHSMTPKELKVVVEATPLLPEPTTTITIIDTDEESPIEVTKDEKFNKNKRDYSRTRKSEVHIDKKQEESTATDESKHNLSIRKLKERDGSESPLVDDENMDNIPRTRRRYSSTPVIDSIPSSPASSDDREYKAWKKSILMIYNRIATHRHASLFLRPVTEDMAPNYKTIVLRPMDLHTIKKNIENGLIRTTTEFQRDVMLMCHNAIMYNKKDNNVFSMAKEMMTESVAVIESLIENVKRDSEKIQSSATVKGRSRKSHRLP